MLSKTQTGQNRPNCSQSKMLLFVFRKDTPSRSVTVIQPIPFLQPTVQLESMPSAVCHNNNPVEGGEKSLTVTQNKHPLIHSPAIQYVCLEIQNTLLLVDLFITHAISSLYVSVATLQMAIGENQKRQRWRKSNWINSTGGLKTWYTCVSSNTDLSTQIWMFNKLKPIFNNAVSQVRVHTRT